ncbi:MerR family transcriptional regulator [Kribbella italica]|uniref:DNA-binding transcriptional MerR regulator n=1 Tax=Kribbella italica TaxID=1540520 RepID=A0A7W9J534_9ACTN|nr:MerR family transcriptional regulator [Kribbella italica]MBB5835796.1 DNA-binding transcriptional MerR regulator [Kribbella italica]
MGWSTKQLAELAGTTLKTVRHYHKVGLLEEPERSTNGYKQYGVAHLVRLLRIRRLTDLGMSLPQIAAMGDADEHPEEALRLLDAELAAAVERIQRVRAELALILRQSLPTDLPAALAPGIGEFSEADRAMMVVYSRVLAPSGIEAWRRMLVEYQHTQPGRDFDNLPADADEETRRDIAERMLPHVVDLLETYPDVVAAQFEAPGGIQQVARAVGVAIRELFNPAQLDVMRRINRLLPQEHRER